MEESGWEEVRKMRQKAENSRRENGISEQILKMINKDPEIFGKCKMVPVGYGYWLTMAYKF